MVKTAFAMADGYPVSVGDAAEVAWQELLAGSYQVLRIVSSDGMSCRPKSAEHARKRQLYIT